MKIAFTFIVFTTLMFLLPPVSNAQESAQRPLGLRLAKAAGKITLEFDADKKIYNVLVVVSDSLGTTLFMDNQYRFEGHYKSDIDLRKPGNYSVDITCDDRHFTQKVKVP